MSCPQKVGLNRKREKLTNKKKSDEGKDLTSESPRITQEIV